MKSVMVMVSALVLLGCQSFTIEMDPGWTGDEVVDQSDESTVIDITDPSDDVAPPLDCTAIFCPAILLCDDYAFLDQDTIDCCSGCEDGQSRCDPEQQYPYHELQYACVEGCWIDSGNCAWGDYCHTHTNAEGGIECLPLPMSRDGVCDYEVEWHDPDCFDCELCDIAGEAFCSRSFPPPDTSAADTLIECYAQSAYGLNCWKGQSCPSSGAGICVEDFTRNYAACAPPPGDNFLDFCDPFGCTGAYLCESFGGTNDDDQNICGYCGKCCEPSENFPLCGYSGQQNPAELAYFNNGDFCFDAFPCNSSQYCLFNQNYQPECKDITWSSD